MVAVAQFWHFIPLNPAVLGGWRRWPALREYGSSGVRRCRLRRPPTTNHCVVVGCKGHHGGSSGGGQFGPSGLDSATSRPNRPQTDGKSVLKWPDRWNRAFQLGSPPQYQNLLKGISSYQAHAHENNKEGSKGPRKKNTETR